MTDSGMVLWFIEEVLGPGAEMDRFGPGNRMFFVRAGRVGVGGREYIVDRGWFGGPARIGAAREGATLWRWELTTAAAEAPLAHGDDVHSTVKLSEPITTLATDDGWLMRLDSITYPPGSCERLHTHLGPGMRVLADGAIRVDTAGASTTYAPDEAWFEPGPEPVFAQADADTETRVIRVMLLPQSRKGRSSIRYVRAEDEAGERPQKYLVYRDQAIEI